MIVVANPTDQPIREVISTRNSKLMSGWKLQDALGGDDATVFAGLVELNLPPKSVRVYQPFMGQSDRDYTAYKRVR